MKLQVHELRRVIQMRTRRSFTCLALLIGSFYCMPFQVCRMGTQPGSCTAIPSLFFLDALKGHLIVYS